MIDLRRDPVASSVGNRRPASTVVLCSLFVLFVLAVFFDPIFLRRNFAARDPLLFHYPLEKAVHDAYARGRLPVWISDISGGRPLLANPNVGALYPIRPLLSIFSFPFALRLFPILHFAAAGVGMILFLLVLGVSRGGAWVGAATYVFSGVSVSEVFYPNIHPGMALLPWILWGMARPSVSAARGGAVLAIPWALILLAGDVFAGIVALLASIFWILLETEPPRRAARSWRLAAALGLAGFAAAPQILAAALWIPETRRAVSGISVAEVVRFSIHPLRLLELVVPFPFGPVWDFDRTRVWGSTLHHGRMLGFFTSFYAGAFAVIALAVTWKSRERGVRVARALLVVAVAFATPPSLFPHSWGDLHFPLPLRYPEKFAISLALALATLAGLGFDSWRRNRSETRWPLSMGVVLALAAVTAALLPEASGGLGVRVIGANPKVAAIAGRSLPGALAEAGLLWAATLIALDALRRQARPLLAAGLGLLTLVPVAANRRIALTFPEADLFTMPPLDRYLTRIDPRGDFRSLDEEGYVPPTRLTDPGWQADISGAAYARRSWLPYSHVLWGRGTVFNGDLDAGDLSRVESLRRISYLAAGYLGSESFFAALSLKWAVRFRDQPPMAGYRRFGGEGLTMWDVLDSALPDVRLLETWREEPGALAAMNRIGRMNPGEIVLESGVAGDGRARPGRLRVLEKSPERLLVETDAADPTWLFVLRAYWNHRRILLDGHLTEDVPAQLAFSAVRIPSGHHTIDWRERVPGFSVSAWGPVIFGLAALAVGLGVGTRRNP